MGDQVGHEAGEEFLGEHGLDLLAGHAEALARFDVDTAHKGLSLARRLCLARVELFLQVRCRGLGEGSGGGSKGGQEPPRSIQYKTTFLRLWRCTELMKHHLKIFC